jgi:DNA transformation protein
MDTAIQDFHDHIMGDILSHIDNITSRKMFGGYGLYHNGRIFAIITSDTGIYFKVDATNQSQYEAYGSEPFVYTGHKTKKPTQMPYWLVPEEVLEDRELIEEWVLQSAALSKKK